MKRFTKLKKRVAKLENNSTIELLENTTQNAAKKRYTENMTGEPLQKKRTALGDLTNAIGKSNLGNNRTGQIEIVKPKLVIEELSATTSSPGTVSSSQESTTSDKYMTALEDSPEKPIKNKEMNINVPEEESTLPEGVTDFDAENMHDHLMAPEYAMDIFNYYKEREQNFLLRPYLQNQPGVTARMRAILVDWLVELQENMELNHETLYQAVKMIDQFLEKRRVPKDRLQLLGATAVLIACKYEERCPPPISDFLYVCDDAYSQEDMLQLEREVLQAIEFEVGSPISYRFLRRYAKCAKLSMDLLTLARYVLEMSLHDYDMVFKRESVKAAASLYLALRMKDLDWSPQLEYYSGYRKEELLDTAIQLNVILHNPIREVRNVINKYSHRVFFEVAKVPLFPENSRTLQRVEDLSMEF